MALYNDKVMEYFMNPHNVGEIENPDGKGTYGSPVCGDMMQITISVDDNDVITDAKFKTFGCGSAIASSSMATDMIIGMKVEDVKSRISKDDLAYDVKSIKAFELVKENAKITEKSVTAEELEKLNAPETTEESEEKSEETEEKPKKKTTRKPRAKKTAEPAEEPTEE